MIDVTSVVAKFVEIRNARKALVDSHKKELAPYDTALRKLEAALIQYLNETGTKSARTDAGTVYTKSHVQHTISDRTEFLDWMLSNRRFDCIDLHANTPACEAEFKESGEMPPGLARREVLVARVNRA